MRRIIAILLVLGLAALACGVTLDTGDQGPTTNTDDAVASSVAATLAAEQVIPPSLEAPVQTGTVTGKMCAPFEGFPPDSLYLEEVNTHELTEVFVDKDSGTYTIELDPGNYIAYAWMPQFTFGGSYSEAGSCGLDQECTDHSLITFSVVAEQTTSNIDVCDWNGGPGSVPLPPGVSPDALFGSISGAMCYPSEGIPPMTLYFEEVNTQALTEVAIAQDQGNYSVDVPPGNYTAYAWLPDFGFGGSYSQAVPCGLDVSCTDHSLINFNVAAGQATDSVDICDWYGDPGSVPLPPNVNPDALFGSISGTLSYPSEGIPPLVVVAYDVNSADYYFVLTQQDQGTFTIGVPSGSYHVYAYIQGDNYSGAYNQVVLCGLSVECTDDTMIEVFVANNQDVTGIDPGDWYSDQAGRPDNPNN